MRPGRLRALLVLIIVPGMPAALAAQDAHYWTYQFGDRATLLGGTVVGSVVDLSAVYYNPGALSLLEHPDLIAAARTLELARIGIRGSEGASYRAQEDRFSVAPGFFAGIIPLRVLGRHRIGYSLLTRQRFRLRLNSMAVVTGDTLPPPTGTDDQLGAARFDAELNETWAGLTWSMPVSGSLGIGVSQYVAARGQRARTYLLAESLDTAGIAKILLIDEAYEYYDYRLLWKLGVAARWPDATLGLTVTAPSVNVFGSGKHETNVTQLDASPAAAQQVFVADYQEKRSATYRSPLSIAGGASWRVASTRLHATAEWFAPVDEATVIQLAPFVGQSSGDTVVPRVTQLAKAVVNLGLGVEQMLGPEAGLYASFRTDRSAAISGSAPDVSVTAWDVYFLTFGGTFRFAGAGITLGAGYGFGSESRPLAPPANGDILPSTIALTYRNYRLFFALAF